eukprot:scaffold582848_cov18-Prasinocladus_malaysianus.AAC.1
MSTSSQGRIWVQNAVRRSDVDVRGTWYVFRMYVCTRSRAQGSMVWFVIVRYGTVVDYAFTVCDYTAPYRYHIIPH